jgi:beta-N-acetylhexosaminidase
MSAFPGLRGKVRSSRTLNLPKARIFCCLALLLLLPFSVAIAREPAGGNWVEGTMRSLSLRDKIAQLVQIRVPGKFLNRQSPEFLAIRDQIRQNHVGGVVLFAGNVYESAILLNELQGLSKLPLIVAADFERGVSFRIADATSFPWTMAVGATESEDLSFAQGMVTGKEARALGVHWIFAPVVDVNNNPDNPVINIRSYGEDPQLVARLGSAFIRGAKKAGVLTTAKHFPGHGDTATDSHLGLAIVESDLKRLQDIEFVPFRSAIKAGVDSIMTAHVAVPKVTDFPALPATLSPKVLTDLLRHTLLFQGLVVTDALEMGGITNTYWCGLAAVRAIAAGADVLLLPPDAAVVINEVERAVKRGDIPEARIDESVRKILNVKSRMGLQTIRTVPTGRIGDTIASPQSVRLAQDIADRSITAARDQQRLLPLDPLSDKKIFSLVLTSDLDTSPGAAFQAEMRRQFSSIRTAWCNARLSEEQLAGIDKAVADSDLIVCSTLVRLSSGQDTIGIPQNQQAIIKKLLASGKPVVWISFGNPYVVRAAPETGTYLCTFSYSEVSQIAAAKALAGEIGITGKMPVSIPDYVKSGDGMQIPKVPMVLRPASPDTAGLGPGSFEKPGGLLESYVESGIFPGAEIMVGFNGRIVFEHRAGKTHDLYPLASLSSVITTGSAAMLGIDSGILLPGALVKDYLPEIEGNEKLRIRDLLNAKAESSTREKFFAEILSRASGVSIERFLTKNLFAPLGIRNPSDSRSKTAAVPGKALWSPRDLAVLAQLLLNRGMYDHRRYFKPETVTKYAGAGTLWSKAADSDITRSFSPSSFGHVSKSGPILWIDSGKKCFLVLLAADSSSSSEAKVAEAQKDLCESIIAALPD